MRHYTREVEQGSVLRSKFEAGFETSFKAFKIWGAGAARRRHVAEPYANYTLIPEPSVTPEELYQFDGIDAIDKQHFVQVGMRNKYQMKANDAPHDVLDLDVYTRLLLEKEEGQSSLDNFVMTGRWIPSNWALVDFNATYNTHESRVEQYGARAQLDVADWWILSGEYRYIVDSSSLMYGNITFLPEQSWSFNLYGRYEMETSRLEEQGGYVQKNFDCLSFRTGYSVIPSYQNSSGSEVDDEIKITFEFWLRALPKVRVSGKHAE
jgi:hypothetical protein